MKNQKGYTVIEILVGLAAMSSLGLFATGLYVIGHFLSKFW